MIVVIASGVLPRTHIDFIVRTLLGFLTHHIAFTLLGHNAVDEAFLRLEIVTHLLRFIRSVPILEHGQPTFYTHTIDHTTCIHRAAVHIHRDDFGGQFNLFVIHLTLSVQMGKASSGKDNGVCSRINHRGIQRLLLLAPYGIERHGVLTERIHPDGIVYSPATVACTLGIRIDAGHQTGHQHQERDDFM